MDDDYKDDYSLSSHEIMFRNGEMIFDDPNYYALGFRKYFQTMRENQEKHLIDYVAT